MKREILFRGKQIDNGKWVEGFFSNETCDGPFSPMYEQANIIKKGSGFWHTVDPDTVGQYTGLKDKNGQRIFEGDICRNTKTGEVVSVKWHGTFAGFVWSKQKENSNLSDFGELFRAYDKYEVIGNIHDNPELIGGAHGQI